LIQPLSIFGIALEFVFDFYWITDVYFIYIVIKRVKIEWKEANAESNGNNFQERVQRKEGRMKYNRMQNRMESVRKEVWQDRMEREDLRKL
jgi:hypothetical protein